MYHQFIEPTKRYADVIIPEGVTNTVAIDLITTRLKKSSTKRVRENKNREKEGIDLQSNNNSWHYENVAVVGGDSSFAKRLERVLNQLCGGGTRNVM